MNAPTKDQFKDQFRDTMTLCLEVLTEASNQVINEAVAVACTKQAKRTCSNCICNLVAIDLADYLNQNHRDLPTRLLGFYKEDIAEHEHMPPDAEEYLNLFFSELCAVATHKAEHYLKSGCHKHREEGTC